MSPNPVTVVIWSRLSTRVEIVCRYVSETDLTTMLLLRSRELELRRPVQLVGAAEGEIGIGQKLARIGNFEFDYCRISHTK